GISTVGIAPEAHRTQLRDAVAARGVSNVVPLGEAERAYAGMPHDGMRILSELLSWATAEHRVCPKRWTWSSSEPALRGSRVRALSRIRTGASSCSRRANA